MLLKRKFRVDFRVGKVKMSEEMILPYRTEETHMHAGSTVHKAAKEQLFAILREWPITIKHIYELTEFEEV